MKKKLSLNEGGFGMERNWWRWKIASGNDGGVVVAKIVLKSWATWVGNDEFVQNFHLGGK